MIGHLIESQDFRIEFSGLFWIVRTEFSGLFSVSPDIIFGTVFGQSKLNLWNCFRKVHVEILKLFSDSPSMIFRTGSGQSRTVWGFGFDPETDVFGFCYMFWYHSNSVTNGTKNGSWP